MKALALLGLVGALLASGMWVVGRETVLSRIHDAEGELGQLSVQRNGNLPDEPYVRSYLERVASERDLRIVDGSLEVSVEPLTDDNVNTAPLPAREARKIAQQLGAAPAQGGGPKFTTRMSLVKVSVELVGRKYFVEQRRNISRTLVFGGG
jgi:hypothetical protein